MGIDPVATMLGTIVVVNLLILGVLSCYCVSQALDELGKCDQEIYECEQLLKELDNAT